MLQGVCWASLVPHRSSYISTEQMYACLFQRALRHILTITQRQVQDAIHAPHIVWEDCSSGSVYINATTGGPGSDTSVASTLSVLPNVIEKSERVAIMHGLAVSSTSSWISQSVADVTVQDFILVAEGTRIAIQ